MARQFARTFYKSAEWEQVRAYVLMRDNYLCVRCGAPAEEVHHIIHLAPSNIDDPNITLNSDNLQSLCRACHFNEHRGEHGKGREASEAYQYTFDGEGMLIKIPPIKNQSC